MSKRKVCSYQVYFCCFFVDWTYLCHSPVFCSLFMAINVIVERFGWYFQDLTIDASNLIIEFLTATCLQTEMYVVLKSRFFWIRSDLAVKHVYFLSQWLNICIEPLRVEMPMFMSHNNWDRHGWSFARCLNNPVIGSINIILQVLGYISRFFAKNIIVTPWKGRTWSIQFFGLEGSFRA